MATTDKGKMLAALLSNGKRRGLLDYSNALARPAEPTRNALSYGGSYGGLLASDAQQAIGRGLLGGKPRIEEVLTTPGRKAYDTPLSLQEEMAYRAWMLSIGHTPDRGFAVDNEFTGENYDYRGYFKKYGGVKLGEGAHLTDEFKLPTHPSFSNESVYGQPGTAGAPFAGSWRGEEYTPSLVRYIMSLRKK